MELKATIEAAARAVREVDALVITAGAGIGVDSGLPDFRGREGFWRAYPPIAKLGLSFTEMANPYWFDRNPRLAWAFYGHRLNLYRNTEPHRGFDQLLELAESKPSGYFVFTSNVDGHFQKAGFDEGRIEECHGSIHHFQCAAVCSHAIWDGGETEVEVDEERFEALNPLPACERCGGTARPNILMFGDWAWISSRTEEQGMRFGAWLRDLKSDGRKLAVIEVGAGRAVPTVRYRSESLARSHGASLVRINPRDYETPPGDCHSIPLGAAEGIAAIVC
ncbi:MAG TPA: Sir2 family NAD-dependent protein deacetylase [Acidobacteriota bacterium]|nr:Sir2 family NAD-dependent protein deacetylase [Acidobacteriota bacterium]